MLGSEGARENGFAKSDKSLLHFFRRVELETKKKATLNPRFSSTQARDQGESCMHNNQI
jgi:hypothetical protein